MIYADLLSAIASYTKRGDTAALAPTWVSMTEAKLSRELRHFRGLTRATLSISTEFTNVPADLIAVRSARLISSPFGDLAMLSAEQMAKRRAEQRSGTLDSLALIGTSLCANPAPSATVSVELLYYAAVLGLSGSNTSNWVLANFPDLYVWGCLAEAANFYEDDEQLSKFGALFRDALTSTNAASIKAESSFGLAPSPSGMVV